MLCLLKKEKRLETILIVDDSASDLNILGSVLNGYEILIATSGPNALQIALENELDFIVLDVLMPGMDGYEVCLLLKTTEDKQDISILFLASLDKEGSEKAGLEAGAVDFIRKPIHTEIVNKKHSGPFSIPNQRKAKIIYDFQRKQPFFSYASGWCTVVLGDSCLF